MMKKLTELDLRCFLVLLLLCTLVPEVSGQENAACVPVYADEDEDGTIVVEFEDVEPQVIEGVSKWKVEEDESGSSAVVYEWTGGFQGMPPMDILTYTLDLKAGIYRFHFRSRQGDFDDDKTTANDVWVKFPPVKLYKNLQDIGNEINIDPTDNNGFLEIYQNRTRGWTWNLSLAQGEDMSILIEIEVDDKYELVFAGRSHKFQMDKFILTSNTQLDTTEFDAEPRTDPKSSGGTLLEISTSSNSNSICNGENIILSATTGLSDYDWGNGEKGDKLTISPKTDTTVTVMTEDQNVCNSSANIDITVKKTPQFITKDTTITLASSDSLKFGLEATGASEIVFFWNETPIEEDSIWLFPNIATEYNIIARTPASDCTDEIKITLGVNPEVPSLDVETKYVLTPNGDDFNNEFKLQVKSSDVKLEDLSLQVFNRQGAVVFSGKANVPWDGGLAPDGVYWFVVKDDKQRYRPAKGVLLLQRTRRK